MADPKMAVAEQSGRTWAQPSPVDNEPKFDADAYALEVNLRSLVALGAFSSPRSTQTTLGSSEAGHLCDRRIAYKLAGVPSSNLRDPLRSLIGSGLHAALAEIFTRLDHGAGRFLIEHRVTYRGIPGTVDLFDRYTHTVVDWKSTTASKIRHVRHEGPSAQYTVQSQLYAAALAEAGEDVRHVALCFLPTDGALDGMWVWRAPFDRSIADRAVDRVARIREQRPEDVEASPDRLCPWCSHHRPGATDLRTACPGVR